MGPALLAQALPHAASCWLHCIRAWVQTDMVAPGRLSAGGIGRSSSEVIDVCVWRFGDFSIGKARPLGKGATPAAFNPLRLKRITTGVRPRPSQRVLLNA